MDGLQFTKNAVTVDIHSSAASSHRAHETHEAVRSDPLRRLQQSGSSRVASYRIANSAKQVREGDGFGEVASLSVRRWISFPLVERVGKKMEFADRYAAEAAASETDKN
ncbi:hypothetical protein TNCT_543261 [Trichonephila clavata]|uniref:Uncharacterized protein n=1 Tax=Trichonephila clavata TaxID=2740835 RepID=A0A8X6F8T8_TRICU|nr:hypothetical protein TNCT_543261 [Trichonephila clavata]